MADAVTSTLRALLGTWGLPADGPAKVALALAAGLLVLAAFGRGRGLLGLGDHPMPRRPFLWLTSFTAALLSLFYIAHYLRGGPRIVDATTYFLQGRAMAEGSLTWPVADPSASFRGRFLLYRDGAVAGIFPPGYPMLLALGFAVGAPMVVGPALAAGLVLATYRLARTLAEHAAPPPLVEPVARAAALLSVVCGALRYHTADTMAHGAAALGIALALDFALRARREAEQKGDGALFAVGAGVAIGAVAATRPVSALAIAAVAALALGRSRPLLLRAVLGAAPGVALLLLAQHAVTGAWLTSSQRMYYAMSDGPPGCFRWGFGAGTGCLFEHEDFVRTRLPHGYGALEAAGTTLRRLRMHLTDVANLEPLALLVFFALPARGTGGARGTRGTRLALALVGAHVLAYAPFYFDGNYPGGGARFFADVLPVEHALVAVALARIASSRFARAALATLGLALVGFAVHAVHDHLQLAERDGGRPMYEPDLLAKANVTTGLVFVDTDHGFALGHDPGARARDGVVVARLRSDDRDRLLFDRLDRPPTYLYRFDRSATPANAVIVPWAPPPHGEALRFEAEAEWPPRAQDGAFAAPMQTDPCASLSRALVVTPTAAEGEVTIEVPVPESGRYAVSLRIVRGAHLPSSPPPGEETSGRATIGDATFAFRPAGVGCLDLPSREIDLTAPAAALVLRAAGGPIALDHVLLRRAK